MTLLDFGLRVKMLAAEQLLNITNSRTISYSCKTILTACPPVPVYGYLLDQIPALDPDLLLRHQVLDDDVSHVLAVGVSGRIEERGKTDFLVKGISVSWRIPISGLNFY